MSAIAEKYLARISKIPGKCAFRGQGDSSWNLHSAATRRLISFFNDDENVTKASHFSQICLAYHRSELLEPARANGFGIDKGNEISDLQLLAKLQHFGAATGLIDFTWDPIVALWFACERDDRDGKVFVLDLSDPLRFQEISGDEATFGAEEILSPSSNHQEQYFCEAMVRGGTPPRALRQRNLLVIGRPLIPDDAIHSVEISASDKAHFRKEVKELLGMGKVALFADIQSFSAANGARSPLRQIGDPMFYRLQGIQCHRQGAYLNAVSNYDKCIDLAPDISEAYFLRGNAKAELGDYNAAKEDYDLAIENKDRPLLNWEGITSKVSNPFSLYRLYFNRGNVKAVLNDLKGAMKDYQEATRLVQEMDVADSLLSFNRGNVNALLHCFEQATSDYEEAIHIGYGEAYFNRGNLLVIMGRFKEALQCFDESIRKGTDRPDQIYNRNGVEAILKRVGGFDYEVHPPRFEGAERRMAIDVTLQAADSPKYTELFNFFGSIGNAGNAGIQGDSGLPGGKGYGGEDGFVVMLKGRES